jgi:hypothetical protein
MVAHFKLYPGRQPVHRITLENVEHFLKGKYPWFQQGQAREHPRIFGVCPACDNPIQLKGLYRRQENSPAPYGSHVHESPEGFAFDPENLKYCPYITKNTSHDRSNLRKMNPIARQLIEMAIMEFDRIVTVLRHDLGFKFSDKFAERMLRQWFDNRGYLYAGAHLRNLPWMIVYMANSLDLFGQYVGTNEGLADAIRQQVPQAEISPEGQLRRGGANVRFQIDLYCLGHKTNYSDNDDSYQEHITLEIINYTGMTILEPEQAPVIYRKKIIFNPERFEQLLNTPAVQARRDQGLLERARGIAAEEGFPCNPMT